MLDRHMLHFLSSLFRPSANETEVLNKALIEAASERVVDGTDPRLRAFFVSASGERRIILPGYIPRTELPERPDFFKASQRYLG
jgi:hypothetical protein